jgi:adenine-specific DNA methylase
MIKSRKISESKTFLENGFPIDDLHELALNEGNSKRPIYQIHKWWARRLGSVFRTLLISSFLEPDERYKSFLGKFYNGFALENRVIYDPMMGGGTSLVEGLRLGCKVIGCDINPVAWFVTKKEIERFDEDTVDRYYSQIEDTIGKEIKSLYDTTCQKGHECSSVYSIWIRMITCRNCKKRSDLFGSLIIRRKKSDNVLVCPKCNNIVHAKERNRFVKCSECKFNIDKKYRVVEEGLFTCPCCNTKERVVDNIQRAGTFLPTKMIAIEYQCDICGRDYKKPASADLKVFENDVKTFSKNKSNLEFPIQKIPAPEPKSDRRPTSHGFNYFYELFNPRQLLSLSLLLKEIKKIPDKNAREFLLLTLSSCLETNNVLCKYETNWGKIAALFGMPGYHVPERYGENNVLGDGRGSFPRTYRKLKRGKKYAQNIYQLVHQQERSRKEKMFTGESIITNVGYKNSRFLVPGQNAQVYCRNSSRMEVIESKSVDAIITDPPYFDMINYSRLADFFYVWLRLGLKSQYSWFKPLTSKRDEEILAQEYSETSRQTFVISLTRVLRECNRVLKNDGLMVFTFHHTKNWAWKGLRTALRDAGFVVTATPIMRSEGRTGFRKGNSSGYDVCVVCRKSSHHITYVKDNYTLSDCMKTVNLLRKINNSIKPSDVFTVMMSGYVRSDDDAAEKIMSKVHKVINKIK